MYLYDHFIWIHMVHEFMYEFGGTKVSVEAQAWLQLWLRYHHLEIVGQTEQLNINFKVFKCI